MAIALLVSGAVMFVASAVTWTGIVPVPLQSRMIVGVTLFVAALADVVVGLRFLGSSE
jgi:hypothetical protein